MTASNVFPLKVNGTEMNMGFQKVVARDILEMAEEKKAIGGKPEEYILMNLTGDGKQYEWNAEVDLKLENQFITIPDTPTQVAHKTGLSGPCKIVFVKH